MRNRDLPAIFQALIRKSKANPTRSSKDEEGVKGQGTKGKMEENANARNDVFWGKGRERKSAGESTQERNDRIRAGSKSGYTTKATMQSTSQSSTVAEQKRFNHRKTNGNTSRGKRTPNQKTKEALTQKQSKAKHRGGAQIEVT